MTRVAGEGGLRPPSPAQPGRRRGAPDLAPINMTWPAVEQWLADRPFDTSFVARDVAWSPTFTSQSFTRGRSGLEELWATGGEVSWLGGPAALPLQAWPRRPDGYPLAHVLTLSLHNVDNVFEEQYKEAFPEHRQGLPATGVLEVFHDLQTYGWEPEDRESGAWLVRWVGKPERSGFAEIPDDVDTPTEVCQPGLILPGWSLRSPMDFAGSERFEPAEELTEAFQRTWLLQQTGSHAEEPIPVTHVYGHSQNGSAQAIGILEHALPLDDGDDYRMILDVESWTHLAGWFGDAAPLEVWMRESDLSSCRFDEAWCIIRTD
jgi:hypothetical protein